MLSRIPFNEFDLSGVVALVNRYQSAGLEAQYDSSKKETGVVTVQFLNPVRKDGTYVIYEIHKIGRKRFIGTKVAWVVQMKSRQTRDGEVNLHGCVSGSNQAKALTEAEQDLYFDFLSVCDFDLAVSAI